jgi:hypothetical protein
MLSYGCIIIYSGARYDDLYDSKLQFQMLGAATC